MFKISAVLDYGSLPGSSHARRLEAADEQIYIAKGPHSMARNPFVLVNEYVCTRLALEAGMPVPPMALIKYKSNLWFGSLERPEIDTFTPDLFDANILNKGECAHLAVFDIFVKNSDRKSRNVLAGKSFSKKPRAGFEYELSGIDFGHALISPASRLDRLGEWQDPRIYYRDSVLIQAELIGDQSDIDDGVAAIRSLDNNLFVRAVHGVPSPWWPHDSPADGPERLVRALKNWRSQIESDANRGLPLTGGL